MSQCDERYKKKRAGRKKNLRKSWMLSGRWSNAFVAGANFSVTTIAISLASALEENEFDSDTDANKQEQNTHDDGHPAKTTALALLRRLGLLHSEDEFLLNLVLIITGNEHWKLDDGIKFYETQARKEFRWAKLIYVFWNLFWKISEIWNLNWTLLLLTWVKKYEKRTAVWPFLDVWWLHRRTYRPGQWPFLVAQPAQQFPKTSAPIHQY